MSDKKIVKYRRADAWIPGIGMSALVYAYGHPDALYVEPGTDACLTTSRVVSYNSDTGVFETLNTLYVPGAVVQ